MTPIEKDHTRGLNGALAAEIRAEQGVQHLSGHKLADLAGIDRLTLRRYLKAERALNTATLEAVADALGVDPGELMHRAVVRRDASADLYGPSDHLARVADPNPTDTLEAEALELEGQG